MKKDFRKLYPVFIWLFVTFVSPFLTWLYYLIFLPWAADDFPDMIIGCLLIGPLCLLPWLVCVYLSYYLLQKILNANLLFKIVMMAIAVILFLTAILVQFGSVVLQPSNRDGFGFAMSYLFCVIIATLIMPIKRRPQKIIKQNIANE